MKVSYIIPVFLFLILFSSGCLKRGPVIHGQMEDEVIVSGKTNNVDLTGREVSTSEDNIRAAISSVLDAMVEAYKNKSTMDFMAYISNDFSGEADILEMAIQRDFSFFSSIELRYILDTLSTDSNGNIFVTLTFNRFLISNRNGESYTDNGTTALVFHPGHDHPVVFSMKNPLIFGISNAGEVATGTVIASGNNSKIIVDERGNLSIEAYGTSQ